MLLLDKFKVKKISNIYKILHICKIIIKINPRFDFGEIFIYTYHSTFTILATNYWIIIWIWNLNFNTGFLILKLSIGNDYTK
jgi:hypothetical protein